MIRIDKKVVNLFRFILLLFLFTPWKFIQALLMAVLVCIMLSYMYSWCLCRNLSVERTMKAVSIARNEQVKVTFLLMNTGRLPAPACFVQDNANELYVSDRGNSRLVSLRPHERVTLSYTLLGSRRGEYSLGPLIVRTSDPLRLFPVELRFDIPCTVTVRPARITYAEAVKPGFPQGMLKIQDIAYEDVTMRRSLREYRSGDEQKRINWRASAKHASPQGQALFTNEYESTFDMPFFVFLNLALDDYPLKQRRELGETAIEIAAAIIEESSMLGQKCGFAAYGTGFPLLIPAKNQAGVILDLLATIQMTEGSVQADPYSTYAKRLPSGTRFFVVDAATADAYESHTQVTALEGRRV